MSRQRSDMGRQSPCCGGDWRVKQIRIGKVIVGIVGLREALGQVYRMGHLPGPETAEELLSMVKAQNWVERNSEEDYKEALLREYTAYWEAKADAGRQAENRR